MKNFFQDKWFHYLSTEQRTLLTESYELLDLLQNKKDQIADFSFIIFLGGKAYEGFLKKYFFELNLMSQEAYESRKFRIGRALNPDINQNQRDNFWLYDDVERVCGKVLSRQLWDTWLICRNQVFHYFPKRKIFYSYQEAYDLIEMLREVIEKAVECMY